MAIIDPVGIDLPSGQYKRVTGGDTLRPQSGDLTVSSGSEGNLALTAIGGGSGGDVGVSGNNVSVSGSYVQINASDAVADINIYSTGAAGQFFVERNPGTPTTSITLNDNGFHVNGTLYPNSGIGDSTSNINIETQSGDFGGNGTSIYITPNLGIILEIGNTIKIDPDGTNNWIYGDDGAAATNPGEPLTLRGGHGNTSGNGAAIKLRGGDGGSTTGNGGGVELTPGATTGGTAGTVSIGTATANLLRFYGTATGTAQQTVSGSRGGNAALADLLTKLATLGIIVDGTSA